CCASRPALKSWCVTLAAVTQTTTYARPSPGPSVICERCSHRSLPSCSVAALWWGAKVIGVVGSSKMRKLRSRWFGVGSESPRAKPERAQRFEQADRVVVEAFADLHEARHLRSKFPAMSRGALQQFERKAWNRLIDYLIRLPPSDD